LHLHPTLTHYSTPSLHTIHTIHTTHTTHTTHNMFTFTASFVN
jgi:hypothetical protein